MLPFTVGIVRLVRLRITISAPALTLIGWIDVGRPAHGATWQIILSLLSSFALTAFGQVFNDIADRELDAKAKPDRPIPAGIVTVLQARVLAIALAIVTISAAAVASVPTLCYAIFGLILAVLYCVRLKNTILLGNITAAIVFCSMLSYGASSVSPPWGRQLAGTIIIFLYTLGNELYKTAMDATEDAEYGLRTLATVYGLRVTARTVAVVTGVLLAALLIIGIAKLTPIWFILAATAVIGVPVVGGAVTANAARHVTVATFTRSHRFWRLAWLPGVLAMLLLR